MIQYFIGKARGLFAETKNSDGTSTFTIAADESCKCACSNKTDGQEILQYDNTFSFEENLDRFRCFCDANKNHPDFDLLVSTFIKSIIPISAHHFSSVAKALERLEGTAPYRNILLACLMSADASDESKANVAWGIATNLNEEVSVRRTATYLIGQVDSATKRPEAFRLLLAKPKHPWTNGQVERMNRTLKEATVKRYHCGGLQLCQAAQNITRPHAV